MEKNNSKNADKERFRPYSAVFLILKQNQQVLLAKRKNTGFEDGKYSLISGHLDGGESATAAMIREALEETGIILETKNLKMTHVNHNNIFGKEYINFFFTAATWRGEIKNMEPEKCDELKWFDLEALPDNTIPYVKNCILNSEANIAYSEMLN